MGWREENKPAQVFLAVGDRVSIGYLSMEMSAFGPSRRFAATQ